MAISIALLGFGISGTLLTLSRDRLQHWLQPAFTISAAIFAVTAVVSFLIVQRLPFNALEIVRRSPPSAASPLKSNESPRAYPRFMSCLPVVSDPKASFRQRCCASRGRRLNGYGQSERTTPLRNERHPT
jgi:hypothetical protein